jgi:hypothetical protein
MKKAFAVRQNKNARQSFMFAVRHCKTHGKVSNCF